jgi:hypothetical protein
VDTGVDTTAQSSGVGLDSMRFFPSSPLDELKKALPDATIFYDPGAMVADAVAQAKKATS